ncbi:radical SAM protein [Rhodoblastus sp.]|uniref:radical SAM protein n=1 Tax=Rhodoblastus sp. TaxID=1962975 RepID=UPI00260169E7|nr:radical SAM protein [Rhodoblastus sp.]
MTEALEASRESERLKRYRAFVRQKREQARAGEFSLAPDSLWLSITENCNFRCVGCYTEGLFKKTYLSPDELRRMLSGETETYSLISLTDGEAFLHPELCEIIEICKAAHPAAQIDLVTNASVPPRGKYRRAVSLIDNLGISIDGATKATYESIRRGGNFERFLDNVREIVAIRAETGKPSCLEFSFTAMTSNLPELPGVVRIAAELGVPNVYFQPMETREPEIAARIGAFNLSHMPREEIFKITDEAIALGKSLGVAVYGMPFMTKPLPGGPDEMNTAASIAPRRDVAEAVCECQYLWLRPFQYLRDEAGFHVLPCCYMAKPDGLVISRRYGLTFTELERVPSVYNGEAYWNLRQALADGELSEFCGGCMEAFYYPWKGEAR